MQSPCRAFKARHFTIWFRLKLTILILISKSDLLKIKELASGELAFLQAPQMQAPCGYHFCCDTVCQSLLAHFDRYFQCQWTGAIFCTCCDKPKTRITWSCLEVFMADTLNNTSALKSWKNSMTRLLRCKPLHFSWFFSTIQYKEDRVSITTALVTLGLHPAKKAHTVSK